MNSVKFFLDVDYGDYSYKNAPNIAMSILGSFFASDVGSHPSSFKEWGINDNWSEGTNGNCTALEKDGNYILLTDLYSEEEVPTVLKMTRHQYIQLLTDWEKKVCKLKPKEVIITHENGQFIIETKG